MAEGRSVDQRPCESVQYLGTHAPVPPGFRVLLSFLPQPGCHGIDAPLREGRFDVLQGSQRVGNLMLSLVRKVLREGYLREGEPAQGEPGPLAGRGSHRAGAFGFPSGTVEVPFGLVILPQPLVQRQLQGPIRRTAWRLRER
jgi:hypothetical protein